MFTTTIVTGIVGVGPAAGAAAFAASALAGAMTLTAASVAASPMMCGGGPWIGPNGIDVEGRPNFDAGDSGAAYIWQDGIDGFDFTVSSCAGGKSHEALEYALDYKAPDSRTRGQPQTSSLKTLFGTVESGPRSGAL